MKSKRDEQEIKSKNSPDNTSSPQGREGGDKTPDFVKWFSELNKDSGAVAGGKGANLAEIFNLKIPVPPGFVITAQAYDYFIEKSGLKEKIKNILEKINYEDTQQLNESTKQIRELIEKSKLPKEMEEEIIESYDHLGAANLDIEKGDALNILKNSAEPIFVAVRSSATTEDLADASFAGQQDTYLNVKGNTNLLENVKKCFASLFTARATYYRNKKGFKHEQAHLAVVVQKMIDSTKSGVIFSKDPAYKNENTIIESVWGLGEGIVSGKITPDRHVVNKDLEILETKIADKKIAITRDAEGNKKIVKLREEKSTSPVLKNYEIRKLTEFALQLEEHYKKPQDIEFAIENEEIYIVQTRPITTLEKRVEKGAKEIKGEIVLQGLAASPGVASGKIKIIEDLNDLSKIQTGDILVTKMTNPDMVVSMQKSAAIVTDEGGLTAHAAIVSREMGIPCIVGTGDATTKLKEGEIITVDGYNGKIYKGKVAETEKKEVKPVTAQTKTKIKVIVDLPTFAERASKSGIRKVGLTRIEGIIAESGKHPNYFLEQKKIKDYEDIIHKGVEGIAKYFDELWIRTSDIRSDEFSNLDGAPKEKEANPMLGYHGIRFSIKNPEILKAELNALKRVSEKGKKIGLLLPQVILVEEVQEVKKVLKEINFNDAKVGVMVETPSAVQIIKELCEEKIDFISFGTNDLTQYILAVDRGNEKVQHLYNEMHPAILYQLGYVIRVCKKYNVETSICGQAGSRKEMVKFLVEKGIDSISVNADLASEIANYIKELEEGLIKGTDKEPRQYEIKKQEEVENTKDTTDNNSEKISRANGARGNSEERGGEVIGKREESKTNSDFSMTEKESPSEIEKEKIQEPIIPGIDNLKKEEQIPEFTENPEELEENIDAIEEEKQEYLEQKPEESEEEKESEENEEKEFSQQKGERSEGDAGNAEQAGESENFSEEEEDEEPEFKSEEEINKDVEAIEEEKREFEEDNEDEKLDIF